MQFSNTTNREQGLIQDCEDILSLGNAGITGTAAILARFTRYMNEWYLRVVGWILEAEGTYEWDDSNYTNFPIATKDLVNSQQDYTLPAAASGGNASTFLRLIGVEVADASGLYQRLTRIDESQMPASITDFMRTDGMPQYYQELANSILLYPAPATASVTISAGLKFFFQRSIDLFTTSDTTQQPGFAEPFHRILSVGASLDFSDIKGKKDLATILKRRIYGDPVVKDDIGLKKELMNFYSSRNKDVRLRLKPRTADVFHFR